MIDLRAIEMSAVELYDYAKKRRLVPEDAVEAVRTFQALAGSGSFIEIVEDDVRLGLMVLGGREHGVRSLDIIPESKKLTEDRFPGVADALADLVTGLLVSTCRRVTAMVPESRRKTIRLLREAGFKKEGVLRLAWQSAGRAPEDVHAYGFVPGDEKGGR